MKWVEDDRELELVEGAVLWRRVRDLVDKGDAVSDLGRCGS